MSELEVDTAELDQGNCEQSSKNGVVSFSDPGSCGYDDQYGGNVA